MQDLNPAALTPELETELSDMIDQFYGTDNGTEPVEDTTEEVVESEETETEATLEDAAVEEVPDDEQAEAGEAEAEGVELEADQAAGEDESEESSEDEAEHQLYTVKVNGVEKQVDLEELTKGYQTFQAAQDKFQAAAAKEKELADVLEFVQDFDRAFQTEPEALFSHYVEILDDPNKVIVAMVERASATGKLHPQLAELFGVDEVFVANAKVQLETEKRKRLEAAQAPKAPEADEWGYTAEQYETIANELVTAAGLAEASVEQQLEFVQQLAEFRASNAIANPYLAFAQWQSQQVASQAQAAKAEAEAAKSAASAVKKASKAKRIPGAATSAGQVPTPPPATNDEPVLDHLEAAERAWAELFGD